MKKYNLYDYVTAGYPAIVYKTTEELRAIDEVLDIARKSERRVIIWSATKGLVEYKGFHYAEDADINQFNSEEIESYEIETIASPDSIPPSEDVLNKGVEYVIEQCKNGENIENISYHKNCKYYDLRSSFNSNKGFIFVLLDFHKIITGELVIRTCKDYFLEQSACQFLFLSSFFDIPRELESYMATVEMELPDKAVYNKLVDNIIQEKVDISNDKESIVDALMGLTITEAADAVSMAICKSKGRIDVSIINDIKKQSICKTSLLEYTEKNDESFETIGGMDNFINYVQERISGFSDEAREERIPYPKGVLLVGVPGCGKSLAPKALANMWQKPLLKLDIGKLFGSLVGETEERTRTTLKQAEAMSPCILWLDEIEKGLAGVSSGGNSDSGVTARMFGTILTWLQEKENAVFVIATANSIQNLPPELLRKGRFDEIFFVDLPNEEERKVIFEIQIRKYPGKKYVSEFSDKDISEMAKLTANFSGAEIEEVIVTSKRRGFNEKRAYTLNDVKNAINEITPAADGFMAENIASLRSWKQLHKIRNANIDTSAKNINSSLCNEKKSRRRVD